MYIFGGLTRHYFTENYIRELLRGKFNIKLLEQVCRNPYGKAAVFFHVIASKQNPYEQNQRKYNLDL
jgi:hypothetical protein